MTARPICPRLAQSAGYTLLEALVVLTIISLASAVIFSRVQSNGGALGLAGEARALTATLREAQTSALRLNRDVAVAFSEDGTLYLSELSEGPNRLSAGRLSVSGGEQRPATGERVIVFHRDGRASPATLALRSEARGYLIRIDGATGAVRVERANDLAPR